VTPVAWQVTVGTAVAGLFGAAIVLDQRMRTETSMPPEAAKAALSVSEGGFLTGRQGLHLLCAPDGIRFISKARLGGPKLTETSPVSVPGTILLSAPGVPGGTPRNVVGEIKTRMTLDEIGWVHTLRSQPVPRPELERFADLVADGTAEGLYVAALERGTPFPITVPKDAVRAFVRNCRAH
jgi:hypothetical protein